jgi:hypothetical protein
MITSNDLKQFQELGIQQQVIDWQIQVFEKGTIFTQLEREAKPGDGIICPDSKETERLIRLYDTYSDLSKIKFIPASGAATRMFKSLYDFLETEGKDKTELNYSLTTFFNNIENFAFYDILKNALSNKGLDIGELLRKKDYTEILNTLLFEGGLNYGLLPKGLLLFHRYNNKSRTPFEEHIIEAGLYAISNEKLAKLHFTVSPEHYQGFKTLLDRSLKEIEDRFQIKFEVSFSVQKKSTDTMAVDMKNQPFRDEEGKVLFRPGGHGALIDNLNQLEADLIFIKNIDNVVPENKIQPTVRYKKLLAGKLIETRKRVYDLLFELDSSTPDQQRLNEMYEFVRNELQYQLSSNTKTPHHLREILNRPIRVCGVVKNLGEPGGGPFWAPNSKGDITLQIIESSQVDINNKEQSEIFGKATHFNPVDLVCSSKSYKGDKFDLTQYIDKNTCFISYKSKDGKELKALELPGLWNGAMADWLTLFVEVPIETFNPVKTVNDLLRSQHQ